MLMFCVVALLFTGVVLLLKQSPMCRVFGLLLLSNGINLGIFYGSEPLMGGFAFVGERPLGAHTNDPLPQALVLTAIVIGLALLGFVAALVRRLMAEPGGFDPAAMREEEHVG